MRNHVFHVKQDAFRDNFLLPGFRHSAIEVAP